MTSRISKIIRAVAGFVGEFLLWMVMLPFAAAFLAAVLVAPVFPFALAAVIGLVVLIVCGVFVAFFLAALGYLRAKEEMMERAIHAEQASSFVLDGQVARRLALSPAFDELRQFFGTYFHQDWDDDYHDEDGVVHAYLEDGADLPEDVDELLQEMDALLALGLDDEELHEALGVLGSYLGRYYYPDEATSAWLRSLREMLATTRALDNRA